MATSASGQDELNRALWLTTRAGKMEPSCPLGTTRCIAQAKFHQKPYNKSFIDQVCSVKMAGYWPRSLFFCEFMDRDEVEVHKDAKKELGQYPAILTSHLVNNPYTFIGICSMIRPARVGSRHDGIIGKLRWRLQYITLPRETSLYGHPLN